MKWSGSKNGLLFKRQRTLLLCQPWIFQTWNRFSQQQPAKPPRSQSNSQVEAQVLPLLEEVIQNKFADEVWVEGVVYDLCPAKLQEKWQKVIRDKHKGVMSAAQYWNTVLLLSPKGHAKWKDFSNVTSHERKKLSLGEKQQPGCCTHLSPFSVGDSLSVQHANCWMRGGKRGL